MAQGRSKDIGSWDKAMLLCRFALEKKANDLLLIDIHALTTIADYFVICSGRSDRQVQSISEGIQESVKSMGLRPVSTEGLTQGHWVLMDFSDVLVHIFYEPVRKIYDLEGLWCDAPRVDLPEPYSTLANQFR